MTPFAAIVPARRFSSRLPDKPLADIGGAPMLVRVLRRAKESGAAQIIAAVDDAEIAEVVRAAGFVAQMTGECDSGSARVAEAAKLQNLSEKMLLVNVQGDEPFIEPELIRAVAATLAAKTDCVCATAMRPPQNTAEFANPAAVKVIANADGTARYFSRAPIPFLRTEENKNSDKNGFPDCARIHIGIYAYRSEFLRRMPTLPPPPEEQCEQLEQLRILHHGGRIALLEFPSRARGVDTPEDLAAARARAKSEKHEK